MNHTIYKPKIGTPVVRLLDHGQVTIPKVFRDLLGLKKGDLAEAELVEGERIMITPKQLVKIKDKGWRELFSVMEQVHQRNKGVSEEQVTQDVLKAIAELRQEEYAKQRKT